MRSFLPGRPQSSRQALCTVSWDGLRLVAYISGSTIIIFNGRREVLQSIVVDEAESLHSLSIDERSGQLAASDHGTVYVYQPLGRDYGDLRWTRAHTLTSDSGEAISCLSWASSDEILVSGQRLALWNLAAEKEAEIIWSSEVSSSIVIALFSPDGGLIASCGQHDRVVKIWRRLSYEQDSTRFDVAYLAHPGTVTNIEWRQFWHQEQNMDNLLYTFCADGNVRVWAHTDHHALFILQKVITIDTNASIQPRRMSTSSISKDRFSFILQSRDLARAAERAIQTAQSGTDHALEHLVEVANRSPEICVILDGLDHMSAWGIENVGIKSKATPEKFNVALVDGVNLTLPGQTSHHSACQIVAFANNDAAASLCVLVHSFSGQIDWYQGSFVSFFDTSARKDRLNFQACWSGHDSPIFKMVSNANHQDFLSLTDDDQIIYWSRNKDGTPVRTCDVQFDQSILDAQFLGESGFVVLLHQSTVALWDPKTLKADSFADFKLRWDDCIAIACQQSSDSTFILTILFEQSRVQCIRVYVPSKALRGVENGYHGIWESIASVNLPVASKDISTCFAYVQSRSTAEISQSLLAWSDTGDLELFDLLNVEQSVTREPKIHLKTLMPMSNVAALYPKGTCATVHIDYRTVSIWNLSQRSLEWTHEFKDFDYIHELYWIPIENDLKLLVIQFAYYIVVIAPRLYSENPQVPSWTVHQVIQTRPHSTQVVGALCWLKPNQIAAGIGNQIITFEVTGVVSSDQSSVEVRAQDSVQLCNRSASLCSPETLGSFLATANLQAVLEILHCAYEELKFLTPGEELHFSAINPITDHESADENAAANSDLNDIKSRLKEYIPKISESQLGPTQKHALQTIVDIADEILQNKKSMDGSALVYLYYFLQSLTDIVSEDQTLQPIPLSAVVTASLSKTQESLMHYILSTLERRRIKLTWSTARALGIFLFVSDQEAVSLHFESVARAEYNRNPDDKNPVDCSLYYLALDKKAILQSLWRRTVGVKEKESTMKLLARDFQDSRWKATALKNAYALLSRRRFEYAAAFFLLGGSLNDAVNVCINQLYDFQLAVAIIRVWAGDAAEKQKVMANIIGTVIPVRAVHTHEARWLLLWGCIQTQNWPYAIQCISKPVSDLLHTELETAYAAVNDGDKKSQTPLAAMYSNVNDPTLLTNVYQNIRQILHGSNDWTDKILDADQESRFVIESAMWYQRAGLDWVALKLVAEWRYLDVQNPSKPRQKLNGNVPSEVDTVEPKSALDEWMLPTDSAPISTNEKRKPDIEQEKPKQKPPTQFIEPSADSLLDSFGF